MEMLDRRLFSMNTGKNGMDIQPNVSVPAERGVSHVFASTGGVRDIGPGNEKLFSLFKVTLFEGKDTDYRSVAFNLSVTQAKELHAVVWGVLASSTFVGKRQPYKMFQQKVLVFDKKEGGRCGASILSIERLNDPERRSPWVVSVKEGSCVPSKTATGGIAMTKGSYKSEKEITVYLDDSTMFAACSCMMDYLDTWKLAFGARHLKDGKAKLDEIAK